MAKMIMNRRCIICGESPVQLWTLDNMHKVAVAHLCRIHGAPLLAVLEAAGELTPDEQVPLPERGQENQEAGSRRRESNMVPLLDWTPPD